MNRYSGPESALIEGEQECKPHVVRILEGIQRRYGVRPYKGLKSSYRNNRESYLGLPFCGLCLLSLTSNRQLNYKNEYKIRVVNR